MKQKQLEIVEELDRNNSIFSPLFSEETINFPSNFKKNKDKGALYSDNPASLDWIIQTNPMTLRDVRLRTIFSERLPAYIPNVDLSDKSILVNFPKDYYISVSVAGVLRKLDCRKDRKVNLHEILGINPSVRILLRFFDRDERLEKVSLEGIKLIKELVELDIDVFTSPNFSVVLNYPISDSIINVKRSLIFAQQLSDQGASVVPHIFWASTPHMEMLIDWINKSKNNVRTIIIDLGEGGRSFFEKTLIDLCHLKKILNPNVNIIVSGPGTFEKIFVLKRILKEFTLIESTAARSAKLGLPLILENGKICMGRKSCLQKWEVFRKNISFFNEILRGQSQLVQTQQLFAFPSQRISENSNCQMHHQ